MIRIIKIGNLVYENIEPKYIDENGNEIWNVPQNVEELRKCFIDTVKWLAYGELAKTDWLVTRHVEQLNAGVPTSLTDAEFQSLCNERQAIRDWSNQKESEILNMSFDELLNLNLELGK